MWFYARRKKVSWTGLGDGICIGAPIGLFCGRVANFINGELYGRVTDSALGIKFPNTLCDRGRPENANFGDAVEAAFAVDEGFVQWYNDIGRMSGDKRVILDGLEAAQRKNPAISEAIEPFLNPRHASQLYEAALEGAVLFVILLWVRLRWPKLPNGVITGLFFVLYAVFRITVEQFREPDSLLVFGGPMTQGQFLSLFMIAIGAAFLVAAFRKRPATAVQEKP